MLAQCEIRTFAADFLRLARRVAPQMRQGDRRRQCSPDRQVREHRFAQGRINEVEGLELVGGNAALALEPALVCAGALLSLETASSTTMLTCWRCATPRFLTAILAGSASSSQVPNFQFLCGDC